MGLRALGIVLVATTIACGGSSSGPNGQVVITGTVFGAVRHLGEHNTIDYTMTNAGTTTIEFNARMCPGILQVFDAQQKLVYDARYFPMSCSATPLPTTVAPGGS